MFTVCSVQKKKKKKDELTWANISVTIPILVFG